jgi:hypothetical protein
MLSPARELEASIPPAKALLNAPKSIGGLEMEGNWMNRTRTSSIVGLVFEASRLSIRVTSKASKNENPFSIPQQPQVFNSLQLFDISMDSPDHSQGVRLRNHIVPARFEIQSSCCRMKTIITKCTLPVDVSLEPRHCLPVYLWHYIDRSGSSQAAQSQI